MTTPAANQPTIGDDDDDDDSFSNMNIPISAVALSTPGSGSQGDAGRHGLSVTSSERYNPFEGAGVISSWRFELPTALRAFDYTSISDVVLNIKYTTGDGGDRLRVIAEGALSDRVRLLEDES